jgi:hypothetical protein
MKWLLAFALLFAVVAATNAQDDKRLVYFMMPNADTCAKILPLETVQTQYRLTNEDALKLREYGIVVGWLQGYVSGINAFNDKSDGNSHKGMSGRDLMNWLFSFCRASPTAKMSDIINALHKALKLN